MRTSFSLLAVVLAACLSSCTIPVVGKGSIPKTAASVQIGKTTYQELEGKLGKPPISDQRGDRRIAGWVNSGVGLGAGTIIGTNDVIVQSLGVEYDRSGVVNRKVSHISKRANTIVTPFMSSAVAEATRDPGRFGRMKHVSEVQAILGEPRAKRISFEGESWVWFGFPGSSGNGIFTVEVDRQGKVLKTSLR